MISVRIVVTITNASLHPAITVNINMSKYVVSLPLYTHMHRLYPTEDHPHMRIVCIPAWNTYYEFK